MCYKEERQQKIAAKLNEKLKEENVPNFIRSFFDTLKSAKTRADYWRIINDFLSWCMEEGYIIKENMSQIEPNDLGQINTNTAVSYFSNLKAKIAKDENGKIIKDERGNEIIITNSFSSITTKKRVISSFWEYLTENDYANKNIIKGIKATTFKVEEGEHIVKVPTDHQLEEFLIKADTGRKHGGDFESLRNVCIIKLFAGSGIRAEELIGLDIEDVHINDPEDKNQYIMIMPKGNQSVKVKRFISDIAKINLEEYLPIRNKYVKEKIKYIKDKGIKDKKIEENALFISTQGNRLSFSALTSIFKEYSDGIITPHMLRHYVGTQIYKETGDIIAAQRQLGHKSPETTARSYVAKDENKIASTIKNL